MATRFPLPEAAPDPDPGPLPSEAGPRRWMPLADGLCVVVLTALVVVPVWPGVFSVDSQAMYRAAIGGEISNWYAPVLQSIWGVIEAIGFPYGTVLVLAVLGLVTGVLACFRLGLGRIAAYVATALVVAFPPVYGLAGWVGRDVWFAALVLGTVALLGWAVRRPDRRWLLLALAFVTAWFAADARQNGFPVLVVVGGVAGWAWAQQRGRAVLRIAGAAALTLVLGLGTMAAVRSFVVVHHYAPEEALFYQDLLAMSLRRDELLVPLEYQRRGDLEEIREDWVDGQVGAIVFQEDGPVEYEPYRDGHAGPLRRAWLSSIRRHPVDYAVVRSELALQLLGVRSGMVGAWLDRSDRLDWRGSAALGQSFSALADARASYLDAFDAERGQPGPLHRPWIHLLAGLTGAALLVRAGGAARVFGWAMVALQVLLQGVLAVSAPLVEYRFQYFQVVLGLVLAVLGARAWWAHRPGDGSRSRPRA